jgi:predicted transglutaminase-like cysteine proteinase
MRGHFSSSVSRSLLALSLCGGLAACATTQGPNQGVSRLAVQTARPDLPAAAARAMPLGGPVDAPVGYVSLCMRSPIDCVQSDTPQTRANAVLQAQTIASARWQRVMELAASRGQIEAAPPPPASTGAPPSAAVAADASAPVSQAAASFVPQPSLPQPAVLTLASATVPAPAPALAPTTDLQITLDEPTWARLRQINAFVNRAIHPAKDLEVYGVKDWWVAPISMGLRPLGDCKDYVMEKRRELIGAGLPSRALTIALVRTAWGESHAVLVVATSQGDLVLDNLSPDIRPWDRTPYAWEARQSAEDPLVWLAVADKFVLPAPRNPHAQLAFADERRAFRR